MTAAVVPMPEEVADVLRVHAMGGNLRELAAACRIAAPRHSQPGRGRLTRSAAVLAWTADLMDAMAEHAPELDQHASERR